MGNYSLHLWAGLNLHEVARCPAKGVPSERKRGSLFVPLFLSLCPIMPPYPHPMNMLRDVHGNFSLNYSVGNLWWEIFTYITLGVQMCFQQQVHGCVGLPLGDLPCHALDHKLRSGIIGLTYWGEINSQLALNFRGRGLGDKQHKKSPPKLTIFSKWQKCLLKLDLK